MKCQSITDHDFRAFAFLSFSFPKRLTAALLPNSPKHEAHTTPIHPRNSVLKQNIRRFKEIKICYLVYRDVYATKLTYEDTR
jgi:hypothetical protein